MDADALAEALNALIDDPRRRAEMGAFAKKRIETEFRAETVARTEFELYRELLA
jgi:glycosyltransferase involved in cell wall biosynthesis